MPWNWPWPATRTWRGPRAEEEATEADARQTGAWDNPALFFRLEAAPRRGDSWAGGERILGLAQEIPLWGVSGKAKAVGQARARAALARESLAGQELKAEVRAAHAAALWARGTAELQEEGLKVAQNLGALVERRLQAGDASQADLHRATLARARAEVDRDVALVRYQGAQARLALLLGLGSLDGWELASGRDDPLPLAADDEVSARLFVLGAQAAVSAAEVTLVSRSRWPRLELEAGLRGSSEEDAFDLGLRLGLPLWDRGAEGLKAARARQSAAEHQAEWGRRQRSAQLREAGLEEEAAARALKTFAEEIVPSAEAALRSASAAFELGDVGLTDVLQVSREWIAARQGLLDWVRNQAEARARRVNWQ